MTGSVVYGLLLSTKVLDAIAHRPISFALHQDLAAVGLGLAGVHGALLGLDATVPFSIQQMVVPGLAPYAPLAVAAGQLTFYVTAIVVASFYARRRIGQRAWRALHVLTFLAFAGATAHGILAGIGQRRRMDLVDVRRVRDDRDVPVRLPTGHGAGSPTGRQRGSRCSALNPSRSRLRARSNGTSRPTIGRRSSAVGW